jgi:hypothetical protein
MSQYTIKYACGHGSTLKNLTGPTAGRDSYVEWAERTMVCGECYKAKKSAEDAAAPTTAKIVLVPGLEPVIAIEVSGQIEVHKDALYTLGYRWSDSTSGGLMGYFSMARPQRVLALVCAVESAEQAGEWISGHQASLADLGYTVTDSLSPIDMAYLAKILAERTNKTDAHAAAVAKLAEIKANDPRPAASPLRQRIANAEKKSGANWNGKIYGKSGSWSFYVADTKYTATDAEVAARNSNIADCAAWDSKYAAQIAAAK